MGVGVIGLGDMGSGIAKNLILNGYTTTGFDLSEERMQAFIAMGGNAAANVKEFIVDGDRVYATATYPTANIRPLLTVVASESAHLKRIHPLEPAANIQQGTIRDHGMNGAGKKCVNIGPPRSIPGRKTTCGGKSVTLCLKSFVENTTNQQHLTVVHHGHDSAIHSLTKSPRRDTVPAEYMGNTCRPDLLERAAKTRNAPGMV